MKQLTIKKKITLWYTGIIAVVLGTILVLVLLFVDKVGISATEKEISAAVTGFSSNINFQDDSFYLDGDTEFYDDGIMFCIYDKNGRLLYGTIPTQFPEETILKSNTPRMITGSNRKWMIYDSVYTYGDDEEMWVRGITSVHSIELFMHTSEKMLLIVFPLLIILIGAIGYFMIKRALRQVDLICDEVENISNGKDLSKRLSLPKAKDELYELSEKFNEMFERLEFSFEKERQFTSDVSHELRTPVAVIISQCEYLLENENLSAEDKEEIAVILRQAKRMSKLTSEMLMIARNEQDEQHLMEKLDFGLLSELVIEELQTKAQEKNIEITLQKQDDLFMNGDQTLLLRMMMNLITNAINYGKANGHIHVILKVGNDQIVGEVKDDGIGISEEHLDKIWERFYRIDKSRSRENGGTGLGLSMVRWIVNLHNGTIHVETVVLLSHKKPDSHINIKVEFGEGEGKVPLKAIAERAEAYKPKERVTYKMIKEYIEAKYGFKVHTAYIAEVKRDLGLPMYDAPNAVEELKNPRKHPTAEKVEAIKDALKYFEVI